MNQTIVSNNKRDICGVPFGLLEGWAGSLFCLQFVGVIVAADVAHILNITLSSFVTASILYVPSILSMILLLLTPFDTKRLYRNASISALLLFMVLLWFVVDINTRGNLYEQSDYDLKRPYFLVHGMLVAGLIGVLACRNWRAFIQKFVTWVFFASVIECFLYLMIYRVHSPTERLGGATALQHSLVFTVGVSCAFAMLYQKYCEPERKTKLSVYTLWILIIFLTIGIVFSGTRAALLGVIASAGLYLLALSNRRLILTVFIAITASLIVVYAATQWIPSNVLNRVTHLEVGGLDRRVQLNELALDSLERHPFGKTRGYMAVLDGVDYAHNTILQVILEIGVAGIPAFMILLALAAVGWFRSISAGGYIAGIMIILFNVLLQSFSSGDAYNAMFWFTICFLACLPKVLPSNERKTDLQSSQLLKSE